MPNLKTHHRAFGAALALLTLLGIACGGNGGPPPATEPTGPSVVASVPSPAPTPDEGTATAVPATTATSTGSDAAPPVASAGLDAGAPPPGPFGPKRCRLPEPRLSDDRCASDADCGPSEPCHAPACVAKAKSNPPGPGIMCTRILRCDTADANRCGCYQGRCALIPPSP